VRIVIFKYCSDFYRLWFTLFETLFKTPTHSFPDWLNLVQNLKLVQVHSFQNQVYSSPDTCLLGTSDFDAQMSGIKI
jgi:hypothetical protein